MYNKDQICHTNNCYNCLLQSNKPFNVDDIIVSKLPDSNLYHRTINAYHFYLEQKNPFQM